MVHHWFLQEIITAENYDDILRSAKELSFLNYVNSWTSKAYSMQNLFIVF